MKYTDIIYLISETKVVDDVGNYISTTSSETKCYAHRQSVKTNEFYNAVSLGMNPSVEFIIKRNNYNSEELLKFNNEIYSIIRTVDPKNKFDIVLVCSKKVGNNG